MIDKIVDFTYSRNDLWKKLITKDQLRKFFIDHSDTTLIVKRDQRIVAVAVFLEIEGIITFISLTIDQDVNGFRIIREFVDRHNGEICWINKKGEILKCRR